MAGFAGHRLSRRSACPKRLWNSFQGLFFAGWCFAGVYCWCSWVPTLTGSFLHFVSEVGPGSDSDWLFSPFCVRSWSGFRLCSPDLAFCVRVYSWLYPSPPLSSSQDTSLLKNLLMKLFTPIRFGYMKVCNSTNSFKE